MVPPFPNRYRRQEWFRRTIAMWISVTPPYREIVTATDPLAAVEIDWRQ